MLLFYVANGMISALVGLLLFLFKTPDCFALGANIVCLMLTLEMPTIWLLFAKRKKLSANDNELLAPSAVITGIAFIVDLVFYSVCVGIHTENIMLFVLYTAIFHIVFIAILLIVKGLTDYIRKQH